MTEEVLCTARAVIVSTESARELVSPRVPDGVPLTVIPLSSPQAPAEELADDGGPPWIVSLGVVSSAKRVDDLLRAAAVAGNASPLRLALVGDVDPEYAASLLRLADDLGIGGSVVATGFVDEPEYRRWIARSTLVVQLRRSSHGEGSAAVADALAAGRPVLTSIASAAELPEGVVEHVRPDTDVGALGDRIAVLLGDPDRLRSLGESARRHARARSFADVADEVLAVVQAAARPSFPEPLFALR